MTSSRHVRGFMSVGAAALLAGGAIAGCGSSNNDNGKASTPAAPKVAFTGKPVQIYNIVPIRNQISDISDAQAAVKAGARAINAGGGIKGHEIQVKTCNDSDANAELACARAAIKAKALAFVGSANVLNAKAAADQLQKAGIPSIAPLALQQVEYSIPINFPIYTTSFPLLACPQQITEATGATSVDAIAADLPIQKELLNTLAGIAGIDKIKYGGGVSVPLTQTDLSSAVQKLNGEAVVNILGPPVQAPFFSAINSTGKQIKAFCTSPSTFTFAILKQIGKSADNFYMSLGLLPGSAADAKTHPMIDQFRTQMNAEESAGDRDAGIDHLKAPGAALNSWLGMQVLKQAAAKAAGPLSAKTLLASLNTLKPDLGGITAVPIDFSKPAPAPGLQRLFNPVVNLYKYNSSTGEFDPTKVKPVNVLEIFGALAKAQAAAKAAGK